MVIKKFEDALCWQNAKQLNILVYGRFKACQDYSFKDQIQRAAVSIMNNIAEGFERNSDKELKYFLYISKGSCGEVRSMLVLAQELNYISKNDYQEMLDIAISTSKLISGFIKRL